MYTIRGIIKPMANKSIFTAFSISVSISISVIVYYLYEEKSLRLFKKLLIIYDIFVCYFQKLFQRKN